MSFKNFKAVRSFWENKVIPPLTSELDKLPRYNKSCPPDHQVYSVTHTTRCTQTDLTPPQPHMSQIYSEVASLVSENESRPYYLLELLRVVQLLNTDYLRQTGLKSLKRVITDYLNPDQIDPQAFSSFLAPPRPPLPSIIPPDTQLVQKEYVYSPTQNFPLTRQYLNTDLSGSIENVDDWCVSRVRVCQLSEAVQQLHTQADRHGGFGESVESIDENDYPEVLAFESDLSVDEDTDRYGGLVESINERNYSEITTYESDFSDDADRPFTGFNVKWSTNSESSSEEIDILCEESGDFSHINTVATVSQTSYLFTLYTRQNEVVTYKYHGHSRFYFITEQISTIRQRIVTIRPA